jgi:glycosyltransferase involved in cell wall biosynthesis
MEETTKPQNLDKKIAMHWISNSVWAQTGYGGQMKLLLPRFKALGYPVSMTAYYGLQGHTLQINEMTLFPMGYHPYGMDVAAGDTKTAQADVCMTNVDVWVCEPDMLKDVLWVPWMPIDSGSVSTLIKVKLPTAFERLVMSKHGQKLVEEAGFPCKYVPCAIDTKVFTPIDRTAAFKEMNLHIPAKIPEGKFLVSMVAMNKGNPSRKALCQQMRAFKEFHDKHPDSALYMHTILAEQGQQNGVNLVEYCRFIGLKINVDVFFPDALTVINGYPDVFLNAVYNASDVLLSVTMGEGFGIPILEAQAAGCPVIVGDWTAMSEIFFSGWKVKQSEANEVWTMLGAIQYDPFWQAITDRLEKAYEMRGNQDYRERARKGALKYDIDDVVKKYWVPVLEDLHKRIKDRPTFAEAPK